MMLFIVIIILLLGLLFWIASGIAHCKGDRTATYVIHVLLFALLVFVFWIAIVYPKLDCREILCRLGPFLLFTFLSVSTFTIWGICLYVFSKGRWEELPQERNNTDIIDDTDLDQEM